jgi:hypothetical protein
VGFRRARVGALGLALVGLVGFDRRAAAWGGGWNTDSGKEMGLVGFVWKYAVGGGGVKMGE